MRLRRLAAVLTVAVAVALPAAASERRFVYSYETGVLPPDARELELWSTARIGRMGFYSRMDYRAEYEVGLGGNWQTAFYLNSRSVTTRGATGAASTASTLTGISSEWKRKLLDPVADPIGLALYFEGSGGRDELEFEAKLLLDKKVGEWLFAVNLIGEEEWHYVRPGVFAHETLLEATAGCAYLLTHELSFGVEAWMSGVLDDGALAQAALFAGPVATFAAKEWWMTLAVTPQLGALDRPASGSRYEVVEHEKLNARLLFSFHL